MTIKKSITLLADNLISHDYRSTKIEYQIVNINEDQIFDKESKTIKRLSSHVPWAVATILHENKKPFVKMQDLLWLEVRSSDRNKRVGTKHIQLNIIPDLQPDRLLVVTAGVPSYGWCRTNEPVVSIDDPEYMYKMSGQLRVSRLKRFYERNGFIDMTKSIDVYDTGRWGCFIHPTGIGSDIIQFIKAHPLSKS